MPICAHVRARQDSINNGRLCTTAWAGRAASDRAERRIERRDLVFRQHQIAGRSIVAGMFRGRRLRDREHRSCTGEEAQCDLARRRATRLRDARQHRAALAVARREIIVAEWRIGDHGDTMPFAPRDHRVLNRAFLQMIEHLIAGDAVFAGGVEDLVEIIGIEIGDAPGFDLAGLHQFLECGDGVLQRIRAAPMQQIAVEPIGFQPLQRALTGGDGSAARGVARQHL